METAEIHELVRRAQGGDRGAFNALVQELESTVFAIAFRRLRNRTDAAEVTQDVFIQMFRKLSQLREVERFFGWLRKMAVRMSINRALRRPPEFAQDHTQWVDVRHRGGTPLESLLASEESGDLRDVLCTLRDLDRQTLWAFYFEGQSLQEMSARFASPVGTIKRRLHTARNRLRDHLNARPAVT